MTQFLIAWALRSGILILSGALLLRALRVRDASVKLAAWTAMLAASLAIPALTALPKVHVAMPRLETVPLEAPHLADPIDIPPPVIYEAPPAPMPVVSTSNDRVPTPFNWPLAVEAIYLLVTFTLLLRSFAGFWMSLRLLRTSRSTGQQTEGIAIRESNRVAAPVTLGILRPAIVLPADWREWSSIKLDAVLAHERSHVRRHDPTVQLLSVLHRTLLWYSPLSWFLHQRIVQTAEEAADDAAVAATHDRASYAEALLDFMQRGALSSNLVGVPMARYGDPGQRIQRILDATTLSHGLTRRGLAALVALGSPLAYVIATAQPQSPPVKTPPQAQTPIAPAAPAPASQTSPPARIATGRPTFDVADVHASARTRQNVGMQGGLFRAGRYELRRATMLDLVKTAYGVDADLVFGGPGWLESDRFDVIAKAPPATSRDTVKLMLQSLLTDRFNLVVHKEARPVQGFVLSLGKGKPKMKEADGAGDAAGESGCELQPLPPPNPDVVPPQVFSCRDMTMETFAPVLHGIPEYVTGPVLDSTGLKGTWDFDLKFTMQPLLPIAGADGISLFDAVDKQLGLKLEPGKVPMPVIVVDGVNQRPTPNPPEVATALPPPPPPQFEVASIRPSPPGAMIEPSPAQPGGHFSRRGTPLRNLITQAWHLPLQEELVGAPKFVDSARYDIVAKAPASTTTNGTAFYTDDLTAMLRALLADRFKMVVHYEDRPRDAYTLVAAKPKLKKADPSERSRCTTERPQASSDAGAGPPPVVATCRNMTMTQFAERLPGIAGSYFRYPVLDGTGLDGAWDFTLTYSMVNPAQNGGRIATRGAPREGAALSDPSGAISLFDAVEKQLGLKLEKHQRPEPVLVIDHIEEKPTEN